MRKHITFASILLLTSVLSGGCTDLWLEPDAPPDVDAAPPAAPPDAALSPDAPPPPPMGTNVSGDRYDAANHRLLIPDCPNNALLALDLATGERSVLIDTWPWTEPGNEPCVEAIVVAQDGRRAFATVNRVIPPVDESSCSSNDLVLIDLETRQVTPLKHLGDVCDHHDYHSYVSMQIDDHGGRLLYLESTSGGEGITVNYLSSTPLPGGAGGPPMQRNLSGDCYPDRTGCEGEIWTNVGRFTFDPSAPEQRGLMLTRPHIIGEPFSDDYFLDTYDIATGATVARLPLELVSGALAGASIDSEKRRMLFTRDVPGQWSVVAVDLATGEETLLYDGSPTPDGQQLTCSPNTAFDSRERRLLLIEPIGGVDNCTNGVFAVDADTGAFTQIAGRIE